MKTNNSRQTEEEKMAQIGKEHDRRRPRGHHALLTINIRDIFSFSFL